jgi:hypothetical protein
MISFAPYLYRRIYAEHGGPIEKIQSGEFPIFSDKSYQASAYLRPELGREKSKSVVYGVADGTGSAPSPYIAQHMAISEALERWAHAEVHRSGEKNRYGFNVDRTSSGMAAFPGFKWQARKRARMEALERFALNGWWDGRFESTTQRAPYPNVGVVRIKHQQDFGEVVVLYHKAPTGFVAYGHAAGSNLASAISRAAIELVRCEYVIARYRARGGLAPITDHLERRCLHFSTPEGHTEFLERVYSKPTKPSPVWRTIFDGEIRGPWSNFATVWRHCVEMPSYAFLDRTDNCFFW